MSKAKKKRRWNGVYLRKNRGQKMKDPTMIWVDDLEQAIEFYKSRQPDLEVQTNVFGDADIVRVGYFYE